MVLLSADGSEEKVYKKITVADPNSCKKKKKKEKKKAIKSGSCAQHLDTVLVPCVAI